MNLADHGLAGAWWRLRHFGRGVLLLGALLSALHAFWPAHSVARAKLLPPGVRDGSLSALLGNAAGMAEAGAQTGGGLSVEASLAIAQSNEVLRNAIRNLDYVRRSGLADENRAVVRLLGLVDVHSLRGGVIEIEVTDSDGLMAREITSAMVQAFRARMDEFTRAQPSVPQLGVPQLGVQVIEAPNIDPRWQVNHRFAALAIALLAAFAWHEGLISQGRSPRRRAGAVS